MSGWDQRNDNDERDPDIEFRWLTAFTVVCVAGIVAWILWPITR
jgi:hypothetical protein